ncbi:MULTISPECIES: 16S rRNA (guanine(527)-N(7))-methyltransferase RsmG [Metabacillus]|jgi:16S rRNA (guanine527-N7)-methyltransferase|uniref:Ribosomal RNA small subunit methyltransferase G n=1 Tax=Metabacillus rhizolycopersici TaxID=2875709 RepID=A0ABS7UWI3_9BACI|nr:MULTISPECIES: 16S rRNA (guanine(527)-N(7))-methyltransferase RsmG [Metabacillus]MBZ5752289.1 16S rRNA (guanine(527)-N(7))-methyltransferase RsmG [Metabacillus rhizolycopersici]MCM3653062.1 16S rRNA (guanine(527)-N(7))-methyltransferase RsmG [Metabacillus litoralis]
MDTALFQSSLAEKGIILSPQQMNQFDLYFDLLVEWNEKMNLTSITEKKEVYLKHFYDSVSAAFYFNFSEPFTICDIGAGAGFPSIPINICFPHLRISIVDSLQKRINFLSHLTQELGLQNVKLFHDRAETFGQNQEYRESFDVVTARAVARLSVLSELCLPLVKEDGFFLAMKAAAAKEELDAGKRALQVLGGKVQEIHSFELPMENSERTILVIEKVKKTPKKYPRKPGMPNKLPIE